LSASSGNDLSNYDMAVVCIQLNTGESHMLYNNTWLALVISLELVCAMMWKEILNRGNPSLCLISVKRT